MWSNARVHLRLSNREFYRLTPRLYHILLDRHKEQIEHTELMTGILAAACVNSSMNPPRKALAPADFMPSMIGKSNPVKTRAPKPDQLAIRSFLNAAVKRQQDGR